MYIKALQNQGYKCGAQSNFAGGAKPRCVRGREGHCFAVCALVCDLSPKAECVPAFTRESERGPLVREVEKQDEKRLGDKIYGSSFARFFSSAGVEGSQRTGKCMYIKAWRNIRYFAGGTKPHCGRGREGPCFAV